MLPRPAPPAATGLNEKTNLKQKKPYSEGGGATATHCRNAIGCPPALPSTGAAAERDVVSEEDRELPAMVP